MAHSDPEERRRARAMRAPREGKPSWDKARTRELFRLYKEQGDEEAREQLIVSHLNLVRFLANKFKNRGEPLDDLIQVGTIGLIKAIDRFEPERGLEFTTFATPTIVGEIRRHFRDKGWSVRVPRRLQELSAKVRQTREELTAQNQREPKVDEIAEHLGVSVEEVLEALETSRAYTSVSLEAPQDSDDGDGDERTLEDRRGEEDAELAASDNRMIVEDALRVLAPREQEVVRLRYEQGLTQAEIAERTGTSQVQVSRTLRRALKQMQDYLAPTADA